MRVRQSIGAVVCLLVVLPACTAGQQPEDDTEVQGLHVQRDETALAQPHQTPTPQADEEPASRPRITRRPAVSPSPSPSSSPLVSSQEDAGSEVGGSAAVPRSSPVGPASPAAVAPGTASPRASDGGGSTDSSSTTVERPAPTERAAEPLTSGQGWGYASLLPHEDGSGWTETSATPPLDRSGDSGHRAFTTVVTSPVEGAPGQLDVGCPSWVAAAPDKGLRGSGTVTAELRAGDAVLASAVHAVEVDLGPSERIPELPWGPMLRVDAADGAAVTCTVRVDT